jgi:hypothetical protein
MELLYIEPASLGIFFETPTILLINSANRAQKPK